MHYIIKGVEKTVKIPKNLVNTLDFLGIVENR